MWNARQQTDPEKMLHFALAARYAEGYVEHVTDMHRNKALASFELGLMESERFELSGIPDNYVLTPDLISRLTAFIEDSAKLHAGRDLDEGRIDHESPNFGAMAVSCAENTAGIDDFDAGKRVGELLASRDKGAAGNESHDVLTVEYEASYGERYRLALYRDTYANGGGLAVAALDVTDKDSEEYMEPWGTLTVNIPGRPEGCGVVLHERQRGHRHQQQLEGACGRPRQGRNRHPHGRLLPLRLLRLPTRLGRVVGVGGHGHLCRDGGAPDRRPAGGARSRTPPATTGAVTASPPSSARSVACPSVTETTCRDTPDVVR